LINRGDSDNQLHIATGISYASVITYITQNENSAVGPMVAHDRDQWLMITLMNFRFP